ncbi:MAG: helix-turn-helix domain-containing protein [Cyclobacteriaceae bacterium]
MTNEKNIHLQIGIRIRLKREELGLTQSQLVLKSGVSKATLSKYEDPTKEVRYSFTHIMEICKVLGTTAEWIYCGPQDKEAVHNQLNNELDHYLAKAKSILEVPQKRHALQSLIVDVDFANLKQVIKHNNQSFEQNYPSNLDMSI